jgi:hypothetical protein
MKLWTQFKTWFKAKFGRVMSGTAGLLTLMESFDITTIKDPLEGLFPKYGHQIVLGFAGACAIASYLRHQYVASMVAPKPTVLPPPVTSPK